MSTNQTPLPQGFEALEPFVSQWALASANDRLKARINSTETARVAFFDAAMPLIAPALEHLDQKPIKAFSDPEQRLMLLALSFAHVALAVEVQGSDEPKHAADARCFTIVKSPADI